MSKIRNWLDSKHSKHIYQLRLLVFNPNWKYGFVKSDHDNFGIYKSNLANYYDELVVIYP